MTAVAADPAVAEVLRPRTWRDCPACHQPRFGAPLLTCRTPGCLRSDVAVEARADRMAES